MKFIPLPLKGAFSVQPEFLPDERGGFMRTFCKKEFDLIGFNKDFLQINHSFNNTKATLRGMHFQVSPYSEDKLIRCIAGSVFDVIVDIRKDSPTFLKWFSIELSAKNKTMILIPEGFAHGFQTLEDNTELLYHHTNYYEKAAESGILYNDELTGIQWPLKISVISEKDKNYPPLTVNFKGL